MIREQVAGLEREIWRAAEVETGEGFACNAGLQSCSAGRRGNVALVPVSAADQARRLRLLTETVLPGWVRRCGEACVNAWNSRLAPTLGVTARPD
jgi:hypothetical protein